MDAAATQKNILEQSRNVYRNRCATELGILSPELMDTALVEFEQVMIEVSDSAKISVNNSELWSFAD